MNRLMWIDMEMTGLDVEKEVVIEVAAIITNLKLEPLQTYHAVLKQPQSYIDNMDEWNTNQHNSSGLVAQIPGGKDPHLVEEDLVNLCDEFFKDEPVVLAGNSIGQDRLFINKYFKSFAEKLHYRMLDVSSFKLVFNHMYNFKHEKGKDSHRALDDIQESIDELKSYMKCINF